jgi:ankyrin repeat protein
MGVDGGSPLAFSLFYAKTEVAQLLADPPVPDNLRTAAALGRSLDRFIDGHGLTPEASEGVDFYRPFPIFPEWNRTNSRQELLDEALSWAARNGQCESMAALVKVGADVNANPYRGTPLLWSVYDDRANAAAWLLDHGADPDLRHDFGGAGHGNSAAAMHLAAQFGSLKCLELLLERGADPTIQDAAFGGTPLGWAQHAGTESSIALLTPK